jgi:hypothetical protein
MAQQLLLRRRPQPPPQEEEKEAAPPREPPIADRPVIDLREAREEAERRLERLTREEAIRRLREFEHRAAEGGKEARVPSARRAWLEAKHKFDEAEEAAAKGDRPRAIGLWMRGLAALASAGLRAVPGGSVGGFLYGSPPSRRGRRHHVATDWGVGIRRYDLGSVRVDRFDLGGGGVARFDLRPRVRPDGWRLRPASDFDLLPRRRRKAALRL